MIAKALVHTPPILILDEPTAGVDVELRQMLWQNVRALNKAGTTILLTTHYLEEAEELCDHIAIINHGKKIKDTTKDRLIGQIESKELLITLAETTAPRMADLFKDCFFSNEGKNKVLIRYNPADINAGDIIERIRKKKNTIIDISTQEPDLEDVFLSLTRSK
jgi:ABC-2 type transport system ATP-binding protein